MYTTSNCTSPDTLFCEDSNCRSHDATTLLVVKSEEEADKVIYCLLARYSNLKNDVFKSHWTVKNGEWFWSVKVDGKICNEFYTMLHNYCEGARDGSHIKFP
jgi:hypothetical protein